MLHGARAERVKSNIDGVVIPTESSIVTHYFRFRQSRQSYLVEPFQLAKSI